MILYSLRCHKDHIFETWFRDSAAYEGQAEAGAIECPVCGSKRVEKAIMAPSVAKTAGRSRSRDGDDVTATSGAAGSGAPAAAAAPPQVSVSGATTKAMREAEQSAKVRRALQELRRQVEENFDYVGPAFAEEARKIHYGETDERPIYGETSEEEARALDEEGVSVRRIPWLPRHS